MALCPYIPVWKRVSAIALCIAGRPVKPEYPIVDLQYAVYPVTHAENAVSALHKRYKPEWPHDVEGQTDMLGISQITADSQSVCLKVQSAAVGCEYAVAQRETILPAVQLILRKWNNIGCIISNNLQ